MYPHLKKALWLALAFILLITACKKDPSLTVNGNVSSATFLAHGGRPFTFNYSYDAQGRITGVQRTNGTSESYRYAGNQAFAYRYDSAATVAHDTTAFSLNAMGFAISDDDGSTYTYDNDGHPLVTSDITGTYNQTYTWTNDNVSTFSMSGGGSTINHQFTYYSNPEYRRIINSLMGKGNKNLIHTDTYVSNGLTRLITHSYNYDTQGRVSLDITTDNDTPPNIDTMVYTY
jgi:hypothetical protein